MTKYCPAIWIYLGLGWSACLAQPVSWRLKSYSVSFTIKNAGLTVEGKFETMNAKIIFDPESPTKSSLTGIVAVASIHTGIAMRDKHLKKDEYFDAETYPNIVLKSKTLTRKAIGSYEGQFDLTIKGVTKEIFLPFRFYLSGTIGTFEAEFEINRRDFGVGGSSWILSDKVRVFIRTTVEK